MANNGNRIAIIGNGCAGAECIKALRESGYHGVIHLFSASRWPIYNPMLTTYYAAGKISFDHLFPYGQGDEFYRQYNVDVHSASPVVVLDAEKRVVVNQAGFELNYEQCLIASGASASLPPVEGIRSDKVYLVRTVKDAVKLKEVVDKKPRKVLVIGASLVGIKLVELFFEAGTEVCLADKADHLFPLNAHPECARLIEGRLSRIGIRFRFNAGLSKLEENNSGIKAHFTNCVDCEEADLVVMCTGAKANTSFIDRRQVEVKQGVLVNELMKTNVSGLYTAGDVSEGKDPLTGERQTLGLWSNARYQGRTAGRNMAGLIEIYPGNIPHNITHFMGMDFVSIGDIREYDRMEIKFEGKWFRQLFWRNDLLSGANFVDNYTEAGIIKNALMKGLRQNQPGYGSSLSIIQNLLFRTTLAEVEKT